MATLNWGGKEIETTFSLDTQGLMEKDSFGWTIMNLEHIEIREFDVNVWRFYKKEPNKITLKNGRITFTITGKGIGEVFNDIRSGYKKGELLQLDIESI